MTATPQDTETRPIRQPGDGASLFGGLLRAWLWLVAVLLGLALVDTLWLRRGPQVADMYLFRQDIALLLGAGLLLVFLTRTTPDPGTGRWRPPQAWPLLLALGCAALAFLGTHLIFHDYPLSLDEFMATFDARIFAGGQLFARVPPALRGYAVALQPTFSLITPDHALWASSYLPVNAAFRALAGLVGASSLVNPMWTAVAIVAVIGVARRLWPDRPQVALIAALLLATSSQVLVAGMTAYAMPAHLALNLLWLWCFLRGGAAGHAAALLVGLFATGLHQLVFHPLFVAPFVLQLWLDRRWSLAALYTLAYAAICLAWVFYWPVALWLAGAQAAAGAGSGPQHYVSLLGWLLSRFDPLNTGAMAKDLLRFVAWQNPLAVPLALVSAVAAFRARGVLRALVLGIGLTLIAVYVLLPYQDHGWGYRYLHGVLGSVCLIAAWGWVERTGSKPALARAQAETAFAVATACAVLILFPFSAWMAADYVRPYARAHQAITQTDADVVIVDDTATWYAEALVRNDPRLVNRPLVMNLNLLDAAGVRDLCGRYRVAVFDRRDAARFGIGTTAGDPSRDLTTGALRRRMTGLGCGRAPVGGGR